MQLAEGKADLDAIPKPGDAKPPAKAAVKKPTPPTKNKSRLPQVSLLRPGI
jgi:hypothetical protein